MQAPRQLLLHNLVRPSTAGAAGVLRLAFEIRTCQLHDEQSRARENLHFLKIQAEQLKELRTKLLKDGQQKEIIKMTSVAATTPTEQADK